MDFFEQELRKVVDPICPNATYVGRACYVPLDEMNRAKIQFTEVDIANHYSALLLTVLNCREGKIDSLRISLSEILGTKTIRSASSQRTLNPYIWDYQGKLGWYAIQPEPEDYKALSNVVGNYLSVFQTQTQDTQQWGQSM